MRTGDVFLLVVAIWIFGSFFSTCTAEAQRSTRATDEEILAAITVHEAGFDSPGDLWGVFAVLANQSADRGMTWRAYLELHSPRFLAGVGRNPWAHELRDSDTPPRTRLGAGWLNPRAGGLPSRRSRFHELVALAYEVIRSQPVCGATAWGSRADYATGTFAAYHAHDVFDDCRGGSTSPTRNLFSHAPGEP